MNRRQQPAPPRPPQQQQQQQQQRQQRQPQQTASAKPASAPSQQYNPNSANRQLPAQVTIPQAISILVARINQLEDKCAATTTTSRGEDDSNTIEQMTARIVRLELDLLGAKDHIMKLQSFTLDKVQTI